MMNTNSLPLRKIATNTLWIVLLAACTQAAGAQDLERFLKKDKIGFKDATGKVVIPAIYDDGFYFQEGLVPLKKGGKWGYLDATGKEVIPFVYEATYGFSEGLARAKKDGKFGFIDRTGKEVIAFEFEEAGKFSEGLAYVKNDRKYGYINNKGQVVIGLTHFGVSDFHEHRAVATKYDDQLRIRKAVMDVNGKLLTGYDYEYIGDFHNGRAEAFEAGKYGYLDSLGKPVIKLQYDDARDFQDGMAAVNIGAQGEPYYMRKGGKWGYIDTNGNTVIPINFDDAGSFKDGKAQVTVGKEKFYIDKTGKRVQ